jgi:ankyrin repeat protein
LQEIFTKSTRDYVKIVDLVLQSGKAKANEIITIEEEITFPLFVACEKGSLPMVRTLLNYLTKDDINQRNYKGTTALWIAACNRHIDIVSELISFGADLNIANEKGDSALIPCCQKGSDSIALLLLEAGIDINMHNRNRDNAVLICSRTGQSKILTMLLTRYATNKEALAKVLTEYTEIDGFPPLLAATELNRIDCIVACAKFGADLEWRTKEDNTIIPGATALHLACYYGRLDAARTLCELGSDITAKTTKEGLTPVHIAIQSGHITLVRYLISRNRDILNIEDNNGRLPIYYASMQGREDIKEEFFTDRLSDILNKVVTFGSNQCINVLTNYGQSIGCYDYKDFIGTKMNCGMTPLSLALINGNLPLAEVLETLGAPMNLPDDYGISPNFWKSYLLQGDIPEVYDQIKRVETATKRNLQNKVLLNLNLCELDKNNLQLMEAQPKQLELRKKMTDGYINKVHKSTISKIRNASESSILGFLDKLKNSKVFPDGKDQLELVLRESRLHIIRLIASGETLLQPLDMFSIYLYTANSTIFSHVNITLGNYSERDVWTPFVICLYNAISVLPPFKQEVYRGVDCIFEPNLYNIGNEITWNTFGLATKDWRSPSELIKDKRGIIFIIQSKTGKDISRYSCNPVDSEILFLPGTKFTVAALYRADIITLGQANIRSTTYGARDVDITKAAEGSSCIIVELIEC